MMIVFLERIAERKAAGVRVLGGNVEAISC
jgi:hypothetical protein